MAIVQDLNDPMGLGMFSKGGRFTSEKYPVFRQKDEILSDKRKQFKVENPYEKQIKQKIDNDDEMIVQDTKKKQKVDVEKQEKVQPFRMQTSRERYSQVQKNPPPPMNYYNPKYGYIDKDKKLVYDLMSKKQTKSRKQQEELGDLERELYGEIPQKPLNKVLSSIELKHCIPRKPQLNAAIPHDKRFEIIKNQNSELIYKRIPSTNLLRSSGRDSKIGKQQHAPDYFPNFECNKKILSISIPDFKKILYRQNSVKQQVTANEQFYNYDYYNKFSKQPSKVFKRVLTSDISKQVPRYPYESKYPSYMLKTLNSKIQHEQLNEKGLEMNNYQDGRFQTVYSSFAIKQNITKQQVDESFEIDYI